MERGCNISVCFNYYINNETVTLLVQHTTFKMSYPIDKPYHEIVHLIHTFYLSMHRTKVVERI